MSRAYFDLTDHACRACYGRVLKAVGKDGKDKGYVRCSECGLEAYGDHLAICHCGSTLRNKTKTGFRCVRNQSVTPELPVEIIVRHESVR